jgi:hypothetical protein
MLFVQPIYFRERDSHSDGVVAVRAIKREKDDCVAYFRPVRLGCAFDRIAFADTIYGLASIFCHREVSFAQSPGRQGRRVNNPNLI